MMEGLESWVRAVAAAGLFTAAVLTLGPGGRTGKSLRLVCALLLLAVVLGPLRRLDYGVLSRELTRQRLAAADAAEAGQRAAGEVRMRLIRESAEAYILDKAAALGIRDAAAEVTLNGEGEIPCPWQAELWLQADGETRQRLSACLEGELGIPRERQIWHDAASGAE